ncbi:MAG: MaoC/PaaZ C-terminal domain-containing protein [Elusimicrobia bacterium]|nr:MaoC/PaaZ C-terminal domain-containing protein [Elusimicrobiota bacterium]
MSAEGKGAAVLRYEDIEVGRKAGLDVTLGGELIDAFARLTGDVNPLHVDDAFARDKGFPGRLAHGLLVGAFFSAIAGTLLPGRDCLLQSARFEFKRPAPAGTRLRLEAVVARKVDAVRTLVLDISARDPEGNLVLSGRLQAGVRP